MNKCLGCGVEKDIAVLEEYPHKDTDGCIADGLCDDPIQPLFDFHCDGGNGDWRVVVVCHECFHKLEPDMWINRKMWEGLNPVVPFLDLPKLRESENG
jgi:hypothetical protein